MFIQCSSGTRISDNIESKQRVSGRWVYESIDRPTFATFLCSSLTQALLNHLAPLAKASYLYSRTNAKTS